MQFLNPQREREREREREKKKKPKSTKENARHEMGENLS
jgi:hypothetical protein